MVSIKGIEKARVLQALFNASRQQGLGFFAQEGATDITADDAEGIIKEYGGLEFDYVMGRVLKVDLSGDEFDEWLYDRDNGTGAALAAIDRMKSAA